MIKTFRPRVSRWRVRTKPPPRSEEHTSELQSRSDLVCRLLLDKKRARGARSDDAMGEVIIEVNALSETLRQQRLGAMEASALLRTVMEEIDLAIFTLYNHTKLRLVNRAGERLLGRPEERLLGFTAEELGLG